MPLIPNSLFSHPLAQLPKFEIIRLGYSWARWSLVSIHSRSEIVAKKVVPISICRAGSRKVPTAEKVGISCGRTVQVWMDNAVV